MKLQYYIMENVAIHGMGGNDAYKVVPKYKKISKINEITIHHKITPVLQASLFTPYFIQISNKRDSRNVYIKYEDNAFLK